jgi:hypothetical protein
MNHLQGGWRVLFLYGLYGHPWIPKDGHKPLKQLLDMRTVHHQIFSFLFFLLYFFWHLIDTDYQMLFHGFIEITNH